MKQKTKIENKYYIISALITGIILILCYGLVGYLLGQNNTIMGGDFYSQCVPFIKMYINKLLNGETLFYEKSLGLGSSTIMVLLFYCMSPLNLIFGIVKDELIASVILTIVKPMLAALFFQLFCRFELKCNKSFTVVFSIFYAMCGYGFGIYRMTSLVDCLYLLPLTLLFVGYFYKKNNGVPLIVCYSALFIIQFYSGFLIGLASAYYLIINIVLRKNNKNILKILIHYIFVVLCAFLICSVLLIPFGSFIASRGGTGESIQFQICSLGDLIYGFFAGAHFELNSSYAYLYCGIPTVLMFPLYMINNKISKKERIVSAIAVFVLLMGLYIKPLNTILHMGNDPEGYKARFTFLISFIMVACAVRLLDRVELIINKKTGAILALVWICGGVLSVCLFEKNITVVCVNLVLMLVWIYFLSFSKKEENEQQRTTLYVFLILFEVIMQGFMNLSSYTSIDYDTYSKVNQLMGSATKYITETEKLKDSDISSATFRISSENIMNLNQSCYYGYSDIPFSWASYQDELRCCLSHLGFRLSQHAIGNEGANPVSNMLFSNKYIVSMGEDEQNKLVKENENQLSVGYMVKELPREEDFTDDVFENYDVLLSQMTGIKQDAIFKSEDVLLLESVDADFVQNEGGLYIVKSEEAKNDFGYLKLGVTETESDVYAYVKGANQCATSEAIHAKVVCEQNNEFQWNKSYTIMNPYIFKTQKEDSNSTFYLALESGMSVADISNIEMTSLETDILKNCYDELSKNQLIIEQYQDGFITGSVEATEEKGLLFISVPYEDGWHIFVDGMEQDVLPILEGAFMGCYLSPGKHKVEMRFQQPYFGVGMKTSIAGFAILLAYAISLFLIQIKKHKKQ